MIDWSKLKPYQNDKYRSFEELCYQIAKGLYGETGRFTSVDDSGGGDGVEFYMTLPNGDQWGWQAKFYHSNNRLNNSRKRAIKGSLEKACEKHPDLKKWILCTPTNFTPRKGRSQGEQVWFDNTLRQSIPPNMDVDLEHWGDSDFSNWLSELRFSGKRNYFFGELELNLDWFKTQFKKQIAGVGDKFDSSLHTETNVDADVHALLGDKAFVHQITKWIEKLEGKLPDLKEAIDDLKRPIPYIEWSEEENSKVVKAAKSLQDALVNMKVQLKQARNLLVEKDFSEVQSIDWKSALDQLHKTLDVYQEVGWESGTSKMKCTIDKKYEEQTLRYAENRVHRPDSLVANLLDKFFPSVIWQQELINESDLHILGDAGIGKTHIACNICDDRLKNGLPALFVRGSLFTTDQPIEAQLQTILDIPRSYGWHDFLQALSAAAEAYHTRIPLIIDGLNESVHNGTFSNIWELGLKGLVQEIAQTKNAVLITTCRKSYEEAIWKEVTPHENIIRGKIIWKDKDSLNLVYAYGFDPYKEVEPAVEKYFNAYKIKADLTAAPLAQFKHPIYLKIFCETKNSERKTEKEIYVGEQTLFEVFDEYLEQCNKAICDRLNRHPKTTVVQPALNKMAEYLWQHSSREIPFEELVRIVDDQSREHLDWQSSKTRAIESEGLLVYRDWRGVGEVMHFTYDLFGGYLIAKYLVEQAADDVQGFLNSGEVETALFGENHQILHPMHEDIVRCLAALLPAKTGRFLHELSDNKKARGLSICALFEISPRNINEKCIDLITYLFGVPENRESFFKLAETTVGHPDHPFNASFWSERLSAFSMSERDLSWTEYVRSNRYGFEETVIRFEETCRNDQNISDYGKKRLLLFAEYIMWILTSTVRPLRDQATRALYWYGRRFPQDFFDLVMKSFTINDPYVSERMLAATYGIAMAGQNDFKDTNFVDRVFPLYAKQLYENMFKPNAPHATTHILARDYAKRTIDIALIHHPDLLTEGERERITPPFTDGGIREWGESADRNEGEYEKGPAPLQMDFKNYTLRGLVNYDSNADESERIKAHIYWRIYDLGFSLEDFGKIDKWISDENWNRSRYNEHPRKIDRYGKKYSWIAFFELAGFRQDNNLLPDYYDEDRFSGADIDPSFPDEQQEYNLVTEDLLGNREVTAEQWVSKTPHPDLTSYLKIDGPCGEKGTWILLNGFLNQKDNQVNRDMFSFLQGLIVKSEEVEEIIEILKKQEKIDRNTLPFCPEDGYTYAGEIPWCDTYQENIWEEVSLKIGTVLVPEEQQVILRDGEPVPDKELQSFWDSIVDLIEPEDPFAKLLGFYGINSITNLIETRNWQMIDAQLHKRGFELTTETVNVEQPEHQEFEMLVPVRENHWSDSSSAAVPSRSVAIPIRQIAETFNLHGQPQSFDLFEKDGKRASITFCYGKAWKDKQDFTYLREDLLERYLAKIGGELIWVIWGNRRLVSENPDDPYENFQEVKTYHEIQKVSGDS